MALSAANDRLNRTALAESQKEREFILFNV